MCKRQYPSSLLLLFDTRTSWPRFYHYFFDTMKPEQNIRLITGLLSQHFLLFRHEKERSSSDDRHRDHENPIPHLVGCQNSQIIRTVRNDESNNDEDVCWRKLKRSVELTVQRKQKERKDRKGEKRRKKDTSNTERAILKTSPKIQLAYSYQTATRDTTSASSSWRAEEEQT